MRRYGVEPGRQPLEGGGRIQLATVIAAFAVPFLLYGRILAILPYADDMTHVVNAKLYGLRIFYPFLFFRFFERLVNAVNFQIFDQHVTLTLLINFLCLAVIVLLSARLARQFDRQRIVTASLAAALILFHPGIVSEVAQMDTLSQMTSALFALGSFLFLMTSERVDNSGSSAILFLLILATLLSKEICFGQVACLIPVAFCRALMVGRPKLKFALRQASIVMLLVIGAAGIYLAMRYYAHSPIRTDGARYTADFGVWHLFKNIAIALGGTVLIANSIHFLSGGLGNLNLWDGLGVILSITGCALAMLGLWRAIQAWRLKNSDAPDVYGIVLCAAYLAAGLFPMALIGVVSEQYLIQLIPFAAVLAAIFLARGFEFLVGHFSTAQRIAAASVAIIFYVFLGSLAIEQKLGAMLATSARHQAYRVVVTSWMAQHPKESGRLCLDGDINATSIGTKPYSVFSQTNSFVFNAVVTPLAQQQRSVVPATLRPPMIQNQWVGDTLVSAPSQCAAIFIADGQVLTVRPPA